MTVKELKEILNTIDDNKKVCLGPTISYSSVEVEGYYMGQKNMDEVLMLSDLNIQPRV